MAMVSNTSLAECSGSPSIFLVEMVKSVIKLIIDSSFTKEDGEIKVVL